MIGNRISVHDERARFQRKLLFYFLKVNSKQREQITNSGNRFLNGNRNRDSVVMADRKTTMMIYRHGTVQHNISRCEI